MKNPFRAIRIFANETVTELKKATWPTWEELKGSTIVVIIAILILGVFITIADFSIFQVVFLLTEMVIGARS